MLPSHKTRILVATQPVDFRKGHDGLASLVQSALKEDRKRWGGRPPAASMWQGGGC